MRTCWFSLSLSHSPRSLLALNFLFFLDVPSLAFCFGIAPKESTNIHAMSNLYIERRELFIRCQPIVQTINFPFCFNLSKKKKNFSSANHNTMVWWSRWPRPYTHIAIFNAMHNDESGWPGFFLSSTEETDITINCDVFFSQIRLLFMLLFYWKRTFNWIKDILMSFFWQYIEFICVCIFG